MFLKLTEKDYGEPECNIDKIWSNYSDLGPRKVALWNGNGTPLFQGNLNIIEWADTLIPMLALFE